MPSRRRDGGIAASALALGALLGTLAPSTPAPEPVRSAAVREAPVDDLASVAVHALEDGSSVATIKRRWSDGRVADEKPKTAQYVVNALAACAAYETERGRPAPRLARWVAMRDALVAAGVRMPAPQPTHAP